MHPLCTELDQSQTRSAVPSSGQEATFQLCSAGTSILSQLPQTAQAFSSGFLPTQAALCCRSHTHGSLQAKCNRGNLLIGLSINLRGKRAPCLSLLAFAQSRQVRASPHQQPSRKVIVELKASSEGEAAPLNLSPPPPLLHTPNTH